MLAAIDQTSEHVVERPLRIVTRAGASAEIVRVEEREQLCVRDPEGALVLRYDPQSGKSVLSVSQGDLALEAPHGNIDLVAGQSVRCVAAGEVMLDSRSGVSLRAHEQGQLRAGVRVDPQGVSLGGSALDVRAQRADFRIREGSYRGEQLAATVAQAHLVLDKLETVAKRVITRAGEVYQSVDGLKQVRAERVRTLAQGAFDLLSGATSIRAKRKVRIDGERIDLG